ncbi:MAG: magnesium/cobalt transporter CorA [Cyanosarcina radialis HA8281-LM2]|jgi:magnesium transporter|nr:magnesium/cobalt transporter CorA [Cyanosarcina radialis HA8281-LM2]
MSQTRLPLSRAVTSTPTDDDSRVDYFYDEPGSLPGTLNLKADAPPPKIILIDYNETTAVRHELATPEDCAPYLDTESVSWVDIMSLGNQRTWQGLAKVFDLHPLVQEDVVNVPQRPKVEDYEDQLVIITWMVTPKPDGNGFYKEQVSFILEKNYLLTVQEEEKYDCFKSVRDRIRHNKGIIRKQKADYLAYTLIDSIIDGFFPVLEAFGEQIEELETEVIAEPTPKTLNKIYKIRRDLLDLRRAIWPQRDAINSLIRDGSPLIGQEVRVYLRDCYDHTVQVMDMVETYRELAAGLMDVYLSSVGNRMNEIMKILTVISTIFIPLTFVAGIYGMNFNTERSPWNMPELNWYFGYPLCIVAMLAISSGLFYFFWRRGWFENFSKIKEM